MLTTSSSQLLRHLPWRAKLFQNPPPAHHVGIDGGTPASCDSRADVACIPAAAVSRKSLRLSTFGTIPRSSPPSTVASIWSSCMHCILSCLVPPSLLPTVSQLHLLVPLFLSLSLLASFPTSLLVLALLPPPPPPAPGRPGTPNPASTGRKRVPHMQAYAHIIRRTCPGSHLISSHPCTAPSHGPPPYSLASGPGT